MKRLYWIVLIEVAALFVGLSPASSESESKPEKKVADNFKVSWSSIAYNKRVSLRNAAVPESQEQEVSETLSLSCEVEILDPSRVLGICRQPIIERTIDGRGKGVEIGSVSPGSGDMRYDLLRYRRRSVKYNPARLENAIRSVLRMPQRVSSRRQWFKELESTGMQIDLDAELSKQPGGEIGRVKGYLHALVAESLEEVDVPFKQSDDWVRLTPDLEIQVRHAWCEESRYRLSIAERPEAVGSTPRFNFQGYLPDRLVVERHLVGPDDKPIRHPRGIRGLPDSLADRGEAAGGSGVGQIKKIRFVIAVNPTHYEIPFVLEHIPLPKP